MSNVICITNRNLCSEPLQDRIALVCKAPIEAVLLREKDLSPAEYSGLAEQVMEICREHNKPCILHTHYRVAIELKATAFHGPMHVLEEMSEDERGFFKVLGASCHSVEEAMRAYELGCTYITASNVFETDCKAGLAGRGPEFIREVVSAVPIPVYGLGGITRDNVWSVLDAGALGIAVMSGLMKCEDPAEYIESFNM